MMKLPSWIELHGAITHFPIALLIVAAVAECAALVSSRFETQRRFLQQVGLLMLALSVASALPSILTGYLYGRNLRRPGLDYDAHWKVAVISTVLAALVLLWRLMGRDRLKPIARGGASALLLVATIAVGYTGHLGGQMVFGDEPVAVAAAPAPSGLVPIEAPAAPDKLANAAGQMEIAAGKLDVATDHLALAAGAAQVSKAEQAAQQSASSAQRAEAATQKIGAVRAVSPSPAVVVSDNQAHAATAARLEAIAQRYEKVAQKLGLVADHLAAIPLQTTTKSATQKFATQPAKVASTEVSTPIVAKAVAKADVSRPAAKGENEKVTATAPPKSLLDPQLVSAGETLARSDDLACFSCHKLNGVGGRGGGNLDGTGSRHPGVEWQMAHLKNPKSQIPDSKMPAYDDIKAGDLKAVATYLASLK